MVESFLADPNSSSFGRPRGDMNVASGVPMLVKLDKLRNGGFVVEDNLFVEITVE